MRARDLKFKIKLNTLKMDKLIPEIQATFDATQETVICSIYFMEPKFNSYYLKF